MVKVLMVLTRRTRRRRKGRRRRRREKKFEDGPLGRTVEVLISTSKGGSRRNGPLMVWCGY